jgi:hypothetical protein
MARDNSECTEKTGREWSMKNILRNCERQGKNEEDAEGEPGKQRKGAFLACVKRI